MSISSVSRWRFLFPHLGFRHVDRSCPEKLSLRKTGCRNGGEHWSNILVQLERSRSPHRREDVPCVLACLELQRSCFVVQSLRHTNEERRKDLPRRAAADEEDAKGCESRC